MPETSAVLNDPYSLLIPGFLEFARTSPNDVKMRHIWVHLNGELLSMMAYGSERKFPIRPGTYELLVTNTLHKSRMQIEVRPGETQKFIVGQKASELALAVFVLFGAGNMPVFLEKVD